MIGRIDGFCLHRGHVAKPLRLITPAVVTVVTLVVSSIAVITISLEAARSAAI